MPVFTIETPNGRQLDIEAADEAAAMTGAEQWYKQNVTDKTDTSYSGAIQQGVSDAISGYGKTAKTFLNKEAGTAVDEYGKSKADPKYKPAAEGLMRPERDDTSVAGFGVGYIPRFLAEQSPGMAIDFAAGMLGARLAGAKGAAGASFLSNWLRSGGRETEQRTEGRTGKPGEEPTTEDKVIGGSSAAVQAALNSVGIGKLVSPTKVTGLGATGAKQVAERLTKQSATEAVTETGQEAISQTASTAGTEKGLRYDPRAIAAAGIVGAAGGSAFGSPRAAKDLTTAVRFRDLDYGDDTRLAANRVASRVETSSDLDNAGQSFNAVKSALDDTKNELSKATSGFSSTTPEADNALDRAKRGEALDQSDLEAIDAQGDQSISSLARQVTVLNKLTGKGNFDTKNERFAGGLSEKIRSSAFGHPLLATGGLGALGGALSKGGIEQVLTSLPGVAESAALGIGGYQGLKFAEKRLGLTSPARSFVESQSDGSDVRLPTVREPQPSVPNVPAPPDLSVGPWGPKPEPVQKFKPDILEPGLNKIVSGLAKQKQRETAKEATRLVKELAARQKADTNLAKQTSAVEEGMGRIASEIGDAKQAEQQTAIKDAASLVKSMTSVQRMRQRYEEENAAPADQPTDLSKVFKESKNLVKALQSIASLKERTEGSNQAEAEAEASPLVQEQGGLDALRNPAFGKRANEIISAANAMRKLREVPEADSSEAPTAPTSTSTDTSSEEAFRLPESPYWSENAEQAAELILRDAVAGGKNIRNLEGFKAGTVRRLKGEEAIYNAISNELPTVEARGRFHKYLAALWGSDSPSVVEKVRDAMREEFPEHTSVINKHLSDEKIKALWTKPK